MTNSSNDPLHGITLKIMLSDIIDLFGYEKLFEMTEIRTFSVEYPRMNPVLKFARKTPWARNKIEKIYIGNIEEIAKMKKNGTQKKLKK